MHISVSGILIGGALFALIALVVILDRRRVVRRLREDEDKKNMRRHVLGAYPGTDY